MRAPLVLLPALALTAGCTEQNGKYPSLLPRPIESRSDAVVAPTQVALTPDPALDATLSEHAAALEKAQAAFSASARTAEARVAVAAGTANGTQPWVDAQVALAELGQRRAPVLALVAELDRVAIDRGVAGLPPYPALESLRSRAAATATEQAAKVAALEAALAGR